MNFVKESDRVELVAKHLLNLYYVPGEDKVIIESPEFFKFCMQAHHFSDPIGKITNFLFHLKREREKIKNEISMSKNDLKKMLEILNSHKIHTDVIFIDKKIFNTIEDNVSIYALLEILKKSRESLFMVTMLFNKFQDTDYKRSSRSLQNNFLQIEDKKETVGHLRKRQENAEPGIPFDEISGGIFRRQLENGSQLDENFSFPRFSTRNQLENGPPGSARVSVRNQLGNEPVGSTKVSARNKVENGPPGSERLSSRTKLDETPGSARNQVENGPPGSERLSARTKLDETPSFPRFSTRRQLENGPPGSERFSTRTQSDETPRFPRFSARNQLENGPPSPARLSARNQSDEDSDSDSSITKKISDGVPMFPY